MAKIEDDMLYRLIVSAGSGGSGGGSGGGGSKPAANVKQKDVNFYDYDGTLVASYTLAEAQALTALPAGPTHDGLTFQRWNWSLDSVNALTRPMSIGAMYITSDCKTRLHIRIADVARSLVPLYISQTVSNGVTIDWGDGSDPETISGTGYVGTVHKYAAAGDYVITLDPADGCTLGLGKEDRSYCVMGSTGNNGKVYCNMLQDVNVGKNVTSIGTSAFQNCYSLANISIPDGVTSIGNYAFDSCYSLANITIPDGVTSIGNYAFNSCYSLANITIPDGVTSIGNYAFDSCYSLANITIPDGVTSIGTSVFNNCHSLASISIPESVTSIGNYAFSVCCSLSSISIPDGVKSIGTSAFYACNSLASISIPESVTSIGTSVFNNCHSLASISIPDGVNSIGTSAFNSCYGMSEYHMKPATPPTLANTNAFAYIPADCIIYVPAGCLEAYQTATNWAKYADYMREEAAA